MLHIALLDNYGIGSDTRASQWKLDQGSLDV